MPAESCMEQQVWREVENLFDRTYDWRYSGYCIGLAEDQVVKDAQAKVAGANETLQAHTYGEVTPNGVRQLAQFLDLTGAGPTREVHFLDLGSGVGKMVLQMYIEVPRVSRSLGVELHPTRSQRGKEALQMLNQLGDVASLRKQSLVAHVLAKSPQALIAMAHLRKTGVHGKGVGVSLIEADMFDLDLSEFTHIYLASLTWGAPLMNRLAKKILTEARELEKVAALSRFEALEGFVEEEFQLQTSWTTRSPSGSKLFVYTRL
eukprot:symbB.v1.2.022657.t1/scaffold2027.1/size138498/5